MKDGKIEAAAAAASSAAVVVEGDKSRGSRIISVSFSSSKAME